MILLKFRSLTRRRRRRRDFRCPLPQWTENTLQVPPKQDGLQRNSERTSCGGFPYSHRQIVPCNWTGDGECTLPELQSSPRHHKSPTRCRPKCTVGVSSGTRSDHLTEVGRTLAIRDFVHQQTQLVRDACWDREPVQLTEERSRRNSARGASNDTGRRI